MKTDGYTVYVHINKTNGKRYVGITSKEKPEHRWNSGRGYKENPYFYSAIKKYGWDGFEHVIITNVLTDKEARAMERRLIADWRTQEHAYGYNMTSGGEGAPGYHPSKETREKLSAARRRENLSEETLRRRSEGLRGREFSDEHKRKIGEGNSKTIDMYSKAGDFLKRFMSMAEAETETGINHSHISQCCNGKRMTAGGYSWKFAQLA